MKRILDELQCYFHYKDGYKLSEKATMAGGWWFYEVFLNQELLKKIIDIGMINNRQVRDDRNILEIIQVGLKESGSNARIRLYEDKPLFIRWWKWLLK